MAEFMSFGEIMLRLKSPGHERFFQSPGLEATFGDGEANVAVSLSNGARSILRRKTGNRFTLANANKWRAKCPPYAAIAAY